jgi:hypothetical protein
MTGLQREPQHVQPPSWYPSPCLCSVSVRSDIPQEAVDRAIEERKAAKNAASRAAMGGSAAAASAMDVDATKTKDQGAPAAAPAAQDGDKPAAPVAEAPAAPMEVDSSSAGAGAASSSSGGQGPGPHNGWVGADTGARGRVIKWQGGS